MSNEQKSRSVIKRHTLLSRKCKQNRYIWTVPNTSPFDELLLSWNAERPLTGHYVILSSLYLQNRWTPWLLYAVWGGQYQYSFHDTTSHAPVRSFQDLIEIQEGHMAIGFRIRIEALDGADLNHFYTIYACASQMKSVFSFQLPPLPASLVLSVPGLSQMSLNHPRSTSLCSPTSTAAAIHYIQSNRQLNPLNFAQNVYDAGFDIYGNWSFNMAQAFVELGARWQCFCARAAGIKMVWNYLKKGLPVVVSVKGALTNSPLPYKNGHLMVIRGYDASTHQILCMDPAFSSDQQTLVAYSWEEWMEAWKHRHYLAYFFYPRTKKASICKMASHS